LDEIDDPRKPSNRTLNDFQGIFVIVIAVMRSDSDNIEDITFLGRAKGDVAAPLPGAQERYSVQGYVSAYF
jgi:hypothetical protein